MKSVFKTLEERGFIAQCSSDDLKQKLETDKITVYVGFDPTADSLHLGHLVPLMALSHFQQAGHKVLLLVGGATGMVGDPSGRSDERNLLSNADIERNVAGLQKQMARFLDFSMDPKPVMLNNDDWVSKMSFVDWLREVGKNFNISYMLAKESVKRRLDSEQSISFTEFAYMTMQAFDFQHLFEQFDCTLQCGGNDQWGNITAGIDLVRKTHQAEAFGLTFHLMTTATGEKFGKSAGNAVWLDETRTSPWDFYQYLVRQDDRDIIRFLKIYTFLPLEEIDQLEQSLNTDSEKREAQKALAFELTKIVHGEDKAGEIVRAADIIYHQEIKDLSDDILASVFADTPSFEVTKSALTEGIDIVDLLVDSGAVESKSQGRRLLESGGIYINNNRINDAIVVNENHLASESYIVLRSGKKNYRIIKAV